MAKQGGLGILHRFLTIEEQVNQVEKVKRAGVFMNPTPVTISEDATFKEVKKLKKEGELKPKKESVGYDSQIRTVDEAVAKYLVSFYVKTREGFDFSKAEVEDVNKKFNYIKNTSSESEFRNFQLVMDRENPESPINFFGQDVKKIINIESVRFIRNSASLVSQRFQDFFSNKIPTEVEVRYTAITRTIDDDGNPKEVKAGYLAKMNFVFLGVKRDNQKDLKFNVNNYKLFKVK